MKHQGVQFSPFAQFWTTLTCTFRIVRLHRRIPLSVSRSFATRKPRTRHAAHRLPSRPNCTRSTNSEKHLTRPWPPRFRSLEKYPRPPRCERNRRGIARRASEPPLWRATCPGYVPHADEQQRALSTSSRVKSTSTQRCVHTGRWVDDRYLSPLPFV